MATKNHLISLPFRAASKAQPETPYMQAKQEWDNRMGLSLAHAKNWRVAALVMMTATTLLSAALIVLSGQRKVFPIVIGLNATTGEPVVIGDPEKLKKQPGALEIKYFLSELIRLVRTVPLDPVLLKGNWLRSYSYLRKDAAGYLNQLTAEDKDSPLTKLGKKAVSVQPLSVVQIPETKSFQVRWRESVYTNSGQKLDEYSMLGTFTIEFEEPTNELSIRDNPLGIFVSSFQWNKEL